VHSGGSPKGTTVGRTAARPYRYTVFIRRTHIARRTDFIASMFHVVDARNGFLNIFRMSSVLRQLLEKQIGEKPT
jgi:hypothetical protein